MRTIKVAAAVISCFLLRAGQSETLLPPNVIHERFARLASANEDRAAEIRKLFLEAGCDTTHFSETKLRSSSLPNIACVVPGLSRQTVVVTAHYDRHKGAGDGAIDNWSGASLLPSLLETHKRSSRRLTFEFVAFTDEERGLIGSREYVLALTKEQRRNVLLNVNIDCIGLKGPIRIAAERADSLLMQFSAIVGDATKVRVGADILGKKFDSDASSFASWKIPVIDFHSLTRETLPLLHSKRDVRTALDLESSYEHYRFLANYLEYLDSNVDKPARTK